MELYVSRVPEIDRRNLPPPANIVPAAALMDMTKGTHCICIRNNQTTCVPQVVYLWVLCDS